MGRSASCLSELPGISACLPRLRSWAQESELQMGPVEPLQQLVRFRAPQSSGRGKPTESLKTAFEGAGQISACRASR